MALQDMQAELRGSVPKIPFTYTKTLINRAYRTIREASLWSFNIFNSAWISPPPITTGTVTTIQGSDTITFDALALAALNAGSTLYSLITQRQFRIGISGIYSIIAFDAGTGIATLDRVFADLGGAGQTYMVYQVYYTPPMKDFLVWISVRNPTMFIDLDLTKTRAYIDAMDPQRSWYQFPTAVVPFGYDLRGDGTATPSSTLGYKLFELWGQPVTPFVYQNYGLRTGTDLVAPTDTLPQAIAEELVLAKARYYAYEWMEANKDMTPRATGPDFRFLMGAADKDYGRLLTQYRRQDREFVNMYAMKFGIALAGLRHLYYNTTAGVAGPG